MKNFINSKSGKIILLIFVVVLLALLLLFALGHQSSWDKDTGVLPDVNSLQDEAEEINEPNHGDMLDMESEKDDAGEEILLISKDDIYSFSMTDSNGILLTFKKQGDTWVYVDDESLDINEDRIDKVLNYLCQVRFINSFQTDSAKDYGLTQESPQYILYDANGYSTLISLGNVDEKTGNVYFALNYDFSTVYVNEGKLNNVREYGIEELLTVR